MRHNRKANFPMPEKLSTRALVLANVHTYVKAKKVFDTNPALVCAMRFTERWRQTKSAGHVASVLRSVGEECGHGTF